MLLKYLLLLFSIYIILTKPHHISFDKEGTYIRYMNDDPERIRAALDEEFNVKVIDGDTKTCSYNGEVMRAHNYLAYYRCYQKTINEKLKKQKITCEHGSMFSKKFKDCTRIEGNGFLYAVIRGEKCNRNKKIFKKLYEISNKAYQICIDNEILIMVCLLPTAIYNQKFKGCYLKTELKIDQSNKTIISDFPCKKPGLIKRDRRLRHQTKCHFRCSLSPKETVYFLDILCSHITPKCEHEKPCPTQLESSTGLAKKQEEQIATYSIAMDITTKDSTTTEKQNGADTTLETSTVSSSFSTEDSKMKNEFDDFRNEEQSKDSTTSVKINDTTISTINVSTETPKNTNTIIASMSTSSTMQTEDLPNGDQNTVSSTEHDVTFPTDIENSTIVENVKTVSTSTAEFTDSSTLEYGLQLQTEKPNSATKQNSIHSADNLPTTTKPDTNALLFTTEGKSTAIDNSDNAIELTNPLFEKPKSADIRSSAEKPETVTKDSLHATEITQSITTKNKSTEPPFATEKSYSNSGTDYSTSNKPANLVSGLTAESTTNQEIETANIPTNRIGSDIEIQKSTDPSRSSDLTTAKRESTDLPNMKTTINFATQKSTDLYVAAETTALPQRTDETSISLFTSKNSSKVAVFETERSDSSNLNAESTYSSSAVGKGEPSTTKFENIDLSVPTKRTDLPHVGKTTAFETTEHDISFTAATDYSTSTKPTNLVSEHTAESTTNEEIETVNIATNRTGSDIEKLKTTDPWGSSDLTTAKQESTDLPNMKTTINFEFTTQKSTDLYVAAETTDLPTKIDEAAMSSLTSKNRSTVALLSTEKSDSSTLNGESTYSSSAVGKGESSTTKFENIYLSAATKTSDLPHVGKTTAFETTEHDISYTAATDYSTSTKPANLVSELPAESTTSAEIETVNIATNRTGSDIEKLKTTNPWGSSELITAKQESTDLPNMKTTINFEFTTPKSTDLYVAAKTTALPQKTDETSIFSFTSKNSSTMAVFATESSDSSTLISESTYSSLAVGNGKVSTTKFENINSSAATKRTELPHVGKLTAFSTTEHDISYTAGTDYSTSIIPENLVLELTAESTTKEEIETANIATNATGSDIEKPTSTDPSGSSDLTTVKHESSDLPIIKTTINFEFTTPKSTDLYVAAEITNLPTRTDETLISLFASKNRSTVALSTTEKSDSSTLNSEYSKPEYASLAVGNGEVSTKFKNIDLSSATKRTDLPHVGKTTAFKTTEHDISYTTPTDYSTSTKPGNMASELTAESTTNEEIKTDNIATNRTGSDIEKQTSTDPSGSSDLPTAKQESTDLPNMKTTINFEFTSQKSTDLYAAAETTDLPTKIGEASMSSLTSKNRSTVALLSTEKSESSTLNAESTYSSSAVGKGESSTTKFENIDLSAVTKRTDLPHVGKTTAFETTEHEISYTAATDYSTSTKPTNLVSELTAESTTNKEIETVNIATNKTGSDIEKLKTTDPWDSSDLTTAKQESTDLPNMKTTINFEFTTQKSTDLYVAAETTDLPTKIDEAAMSSLTSKNRSTVALLSTEKSDSSTLNDESTYSSSAVRTGESSTTKFENIDSPAATKRTNLPHVEKTTAFETTEHDISYTAATDYSTSTKPANLVSELTAESTTNAEIETVNIATNRTGSDIEKLKTTDPWGSSDLTTAKQESTDLPNVKTTINIEFTTPKITDLYVAVETTALKQRTDETSISSFTSKNSSTVAVFSSERSDSSTLNAESTYSSLAVGNGEISTTKFENMNSSAATKRTDLPHVGKITTFATTEHDISYTTGTDYSASTIPENLVSELSAESTTNEEIETANVGTNRTGSDIEKQTSTYPTGSSDLTSAKQESTDLPNMKTTINFEFTTPKSTDLYVAAETTNLPTKIGEASMSSLTSINRSTVALFSTEKSDSSNLNGKSTYSSSAVEKSESSTTKYENIDLSAATKRTDLPHVGKTTAFETTEHDISYTAATDYSTSTKPANLVSELTAESTTNEKIETVNIATNITGSDIEKLKTTDPWGSSDLTRAKQDSTDLPNMKTTIDFEFTAPKSTNLYVAAETTALPTTDETSISSFTSKNSSTVAVFATERSDSSTLKSESTYSSLAVGNGEVSTTKFENIDLSTATKRTDLPHVEKTTTFGTTEHDISYTTTTYYSTSTKAANMISEFTAESTANEEIETANIDTNRTGSVTEKQTTTDPSSSSDLTTAKQERTHLPILKTTIKNRSTVALFTTEKSDSSTTNEEIETANIATNRNASDIEKQISTDPSGSSDLTTAKLESTDLPNMKTTINFEFTTQKSTDLYAAAETTDLPTNIGEASISSLTSKNRSTVALLSTEKSDSSTLNAESTYSSSAVGKGESSTTKFENIDLSVATRRTDLPHVEKTTTFGTTEHDISYTTTTDYSISTKAANMISEFTAESTANEEIETANIDSNRTGSVTEKQTTTDPSSSSDLTTAKQERTHLPILKTTIKNRSSVALFTTEKSDSSTTNEEIETANIATNRNASDIEKQISTDPSGSSDLTTAKLESTDLPNMKTTINFEFTTQKSTDIYAAAETTDLPTNIGEASISSLTSKNRSTVALLSTEKSDSSTLNAESTYSTSAVGKGESSTTKFENIDLSVATRRTDLPHVEKTTTFGTTEHDISYTTTTNYSTSTKAANMISEFTAESTANEEIETANIDTNRTGSVTEKQTTTDPSSSSDLTTAKQERTHLPILKTTIKNRSTVALFTTEKSDSSTTNEEIETANIATNRNASDIEKQISTDPSGSSDLTTAKLESTDLPNMKTTINFEFTTQKSTDLYAAAETTDLPTNIGEASISSLTSKNRSTVALLSTEKSDSSTLNAESTYSSSAVGKGESSTTKFENIDLSVATRRTDLPHVGKTTTFGTTEHDISYTTTTDYSTSTKAANMISEFTAESTANEEIETANIDTNRTGSVTEKQTTTDPSGSSDLTTAKQERTHLPILKTTIKNRSTVALFTTEKSDSSTTNEEIETANIATNGNASDIEKQISTDPSGSSDLTTEKLESTDLPNMKTTINFEFTTQKSTDLYAAAETTDLPTNIGEASISSLTSKNRSTVALLSTEKSDSSTLNAESTYSPSAVGKGESLTTKFENIDLSVATRRTDLPHVEKTTTFGTTEHDISYTTTTDYSTSTKAESTYSSSAVGKGESSTTKFENIDLSVATRRTDLPHVGKTTAFETTQHDISYTAATDYSTSTKPANLVSELTAESTTNEKIETVNIATNITGSDIEKQTSTDPSGSSELTTAKQESTDLPNMKTTINFEFTTPNSTDLYVAAETTDLTTKIGEASMSSLTSKNRSTVALLSTEKSDSSTLNGESPYSSSVVAKGESSTTKFENIDLLAATKRTDLPHVGKTTAFETTEHDISYTAATDYSTSTKTANLVTELTAESTTNAEIETVNIATTNRTGSNIEKLKTTDPWGSSDSTTAKQESTDLPNMKTTINFEFTTPNSTDLYVSAETTDLTTKIGEASMSSLTSKNRSTVALLSTEKSDSSTLNGESPYSSSVVAKGESSTTKFENIDLLAATKRTDLPHVGKTTAFETTEYDISYTAATDYSTSTKPANLVSELSAESTTNEEIETVNIATNRTGSDIEKLKTTDPWGSSDLTIAKQESTDLPNMKTTINFEFTAPKSTYLYVAVETTALPQRTDETSISSFTSKNSSTVAVFASERSDSSTLNSESTYSSLAVGNGEISTTKFKNMNSSAATKRTELPHVGKITSFATTEHDISYTTGTDHSISTIPENLVLELTAESTTKEEIETANIATTVKQESTDLPNMKTTINFEFTTQKSTDLYVAAEITDLATRTDGTSTIELTDSSTRKLEIIDSSNVSGNTYSEVTTQKSTDLYVAAEITDLPTRTDGTSTIELTDSSTKKLEIIESSNVRGNTYSEVTTQKSTDLYVAAEITDLQTRTDGTSTIELTDSSTRKLEIIDSFNITGNTYSEVTTQKSTDLYVPAEITDLPTRTDGTSTIELTDSSTKKLEIIESSNVRGNTYSEVTTQKSRVETTDLPTTKEETTISSFKSTHTSTVTPFLTGIPKISTLYENDNRIACLPKELQTRMDITDECYKCEDVGTFRYNNTCTFYYTCTVDPENNDNYIKSKLQVCPSCLKFHAKTGKCEFPEMVPECIRDSGLPNRECTAAGNYPVPNECSKYYSCIPSVSEKYSLTVRSCDMGYFNSTLNRCDESTTCNLYKPTCNGNCLEVDYYNCSKGYICDSKRNMISELSCSKGHLYNATSHDSLPEEFVCTRTAIQL